MSQQDGKLWVYALVAFALGGWVGQEHGAGFAFWLAVGAWLMVLIFTNIFPTKEKR